jgi:Kef-type K+ transport system membrane component KefB
LAAFVSGAGFAKLQAYMKKYKNSLFYILLMGLFSFLIYWLVRQGSGLEQGRTITAKVISTNRWKDFTDSLLHNLEHPLALLLAQIITIILVARFLGWLCKKIGQPTVIGEIAAGIILGPSLAGIYLPGFTAFLFPAQSLGNLQFLSQIGLILFMFVVGMELDLKVLKNKAHEAVVISHASIIIPFALGIGLAYFIYDRFAPAGIQFASFGLFTGIAMSITAFPVLARIVQERGIHKTKLGAIVITCAAADDITAWCILASVIAIVKAGSFVSSLYSIAMAAAYVLIMIKVVKPFLKRAGDVYINRENLNKGIVAIFFLTLIISSYVTEVIGIHALFGAFMAGTIMPENARFRSIFIEKVEDVALVLLLPLFFVFTGLRTQIGLLNDISLWKIAGLIIAVAVTGKFLGSALAAKFVGQTWKDSLTIGALMNTRGLMELVVLNIGYDLGILTPEIFAMMVIMALVTTFMTGPAIDLINWSFRSVKDAPAVNAASGNRYNILISFANGEQGSVLLRLANAFVKKIKDKASITAMHLSPSSDLNPYNMEEYEKENFTPVAEESEKLKQQITTLFKASGNIEAHIAEVANKGNYDLLLVGVGQSIYEGSLLGKILGFTTRIINPDRLLDTVTGRESLFDNAAFDERTRMVISRSNIPVGIFIDKGLDAIRHVFIPDASGRDPLVMSFAEKLINNSSTQVTVAGTARYFKKQLALQHSGEDDNLPPAADYIRVVSDKDIDDEFLQRQDLMLISADNWKKLVESKSLWLSQIPSTLIIAGKE